jgi:hypothetical protein
MFEFFKNKPSFAMLGLSDEKKWPLDEAIKQKHEKKT